MARTIVLDSFPLSCVGKSRSEPPTLTDRCRQWVVDCISAGHSVRVPALAYYETLRELERLGATAQISRLRAFCFSEPGRFLPLETAHLEAAAKLWAEARNAGLATADQSAIDGDALIAAQALSLGLTNGHLVVATTNPAHLSRYVAAELWSDVIP